MLRESLLASLCSLERGGDFWGILTRAHDGGVGRRGEERDDGRKLVWKDPFLLSFGLGAISGFLSLKKGVLGGTGMPQLPVSGEGAVPSATGAIALA